MSIAVSVDAIEDQLSARLDGSRLPRHVAIIMDGNGRWAESRSLPRTEGHIAGVQALRETVEAAGRLGIGTITVYALSRDNWSRPVEEVSALLLLGLQLLRDEVRKLNENNVRFVAVGRIHELEPFIQRMIRHGEEGTASNDGLLLQIAANYSGRAEIVDAARLLARRVASGEIDAEAIDEQIFAEHLYPPGAGDPDLVIRSGGDMRLSDFLLWQLAYSELHVTPVLWPDFRRRHLLEALLDFQSRDRRFGGLSRDSQNVAGSA